MYLYYYNAEEEDGFVDVYLVDANSGAKIKQMNTNSNSFTGKDERGNTITIPDKMVEKGGQSLYDENRKIRIMSKITNPEGIVQDQTAMSAYKNICEVYDWWKDKNKAGANKLLKGTINVTVHVKDAVDNAYWNKGTGTAEWDKLKNRIYIGDNNVFNGRTDGGITFASSLNMVAHEMGHGITEHLGMSEIIPSDKTEDAAISEAYADVLSCIMIEDLKKNGKIAYNDDEWIVADDLFKAQGNYDKYGYEKGRQIVV